MKTKEYMKPAVHIAEIQHQSHILVTSTKTVGLKNNDSDPDLEYTNTGGNQSFAW